MPNVSKAVGRGARIGIVALALLANAHPGVLLAQAPNEWVGKRVITKFGAVLRVEGRVVDNEKLEYSPRSGQRKVSRIYRVEQTNGPWLWIKDEKSGAAGWVTAEWLIPYDQAIEYFTNEIRANPANSSAYMSRGRIWRERKEYDIALADYNEAIRLDPGIEVIWNNRGVAWYAKKDYDKAIADYTEAIRLDPAYATAHFNRSVARMISRRPGAVDGFNTFLDLEQGKGDLSAYAVILGHLANRQAGDEAEGGKFRENAGKLDASAWPFPAVKFLRGELDEAGLLALAVDDDKRTEARCFLGLDHALKGRKDEALAHFRWVRDHGTTISTEYTIALAELDRLGEPSAARPTTTTTTVVRAPAPGPGETSSGSAKLLGTVLYVPTPMIEARFGTDPGPMAAYVNALKARTAAILAEAEPTGAKGLLVAVGLKSGKRSKVWCQAVGGEVPAALLRTLERELGEVEPVELKSSPAGFALKFQLAEGAPPAFPEVPDRWKDASLSTRSKMVIPPDDLFRILWPD